MPSCALKTAIVSCILLTSVFSVTSANAQNANTKASTSYHMPTCFYWDKNMATEVNGVYTPQLPKMTVMSTKVRKEIAQTTRPIFLIWSRQQSADFAALRDPRVQQLLAKEFYVVRTAGIGGHYYVTNTMIQTEFWGNTAYAVGNKQFELCREWSGRLDADTLLAELKDAADLVHLRGFYAKKYIFKDLKVTPFFENALELAKQKNWPIVLSLYAYRCPPSNTFDRNVINSGRVLEYMTNRAILLRLDADHEGSAFMDRARLEDFPAIIVLSPKGVVSSMYEGDNTSTEFLSYLKKAVPAAVKTRSGINMSGIPCRWIPGWEHDFQTALAKAKKTGRKMFLFVDDHGFAAYRAKFGESGFDSPGMKKILDGYVRVQIESSKDNPLLKYYKLTSAPMDAILDTSMKIYYYKDYLRTGYYSNFRPANRIDTTKEDAEYLRRLQLNPVTLAPIVPRDPKIDKLNADTHWDRRIAYEQYTAHCMMQFKTEQAYRSLLEHIKYMETLKQKTDLVYEVAAQLCRQFTNKGKYDRAFAAGELALKYIDRFTDPGDTIMVYYYLGKAYVLGNQHPDRARDLLVRVKKMSSQRFSEDFSPVVMSADMLLAKLNKSKGKRPVAPK